MSFLIPAAFGLASLAGPLIVLYMLRSRRRRVEISSTLLWDRLDLPVSSAVPWQRLRLTPLLLLQLLVLGAFVLTLARPFYTQQSLLGPHTVFVIDTSGSMAMAGRLDRAKERALSLSADLSEANLISVVEAGPIPKVLLAFGRDPELVKAAISGLQATGGAEDLEGAVRLARGLATPDRPTSVLLFTDGGIDPLSVEPVIGARHLLFNDLGDNLAISAWSIEPSTEGALRAFLQVDNHGGRRRDVRAEISVNGLPAGFIDLEVEPGGQTRKTQPVDAGPGDILSVALVGEGDALSLDDRADLVVSGGPDRSVGVLGEGSPFLAALIEAVPGFSAQGNGPAELLVVDGGDLPEIDRPAWVIATDQAPAGITIKELVRNAVVTYQRPGEPILDAVDLSEVAVAEAQVVEAPFWLPIVRAGEVPLILLGEVDGQRVAYFTFDLTHSNLPVQVGFPILGARILEWLGGGGAGALSVEPAGTPIPLAAPTGSVPVVTLPDGSRRELAAEVAAFGDTGLPGVYRISYRRADGTEVEGPVAVRRFAVDESEGAFREIAVAADVQAPEEVSLLVREWAPWVIALVLILMALEWWVGHQRPGFRMAA